MGLFDFFNKKDKKPSTNAPAPSVKKEVVRYVNYQGKRMQVVSESGIHQHQCRQTKYGTEYTASYFLKNYILKYEDNKHINIMNVNDSEPAFVPADLDYAETILDEWLENQLGDQDFENYIFTHVELFVHSYRVTQKGDEYMEQGEFEMATVCYDQAHVPQNVVADYKLAQCYEKGYVGKVNPEQIFALYQKGISLDYVPGAIKAIHCMMDGFGTDEDRDNAAANAWIALSANPFDKDLLRLRNLNENKACATAKDVLRHMASMEHQDGYTDATIANMAFFMSEIELAKKYATKANQKEFHMDPCVVMAFLELISTSPNYEMAVRYAINCFAHGVPTCTSLFKYLICILDEWINQKPGYPEISDEEQEVASQVLECLAIVGLGANDGHSAFYLGTYLLERATDEHDENCGNSLLEIAADLGVTMKLKL